MHTNTRWTLLLAACTGAAAAYAFASRRRRHHRVGERSAYKADLHEWENEGGNLAPALATSAASLAAGSP